MSNAPPGDGDLQRPEASWSLGSHAPGLPPLDAALVASLRKQWGDDEAGFRAELAELEEERRRNESAWHALRLTDLTSNTPPGDDTTLADAIALTRVAHQKPRDVTREQLWTWLQRATAPSAWHPPLSLERPLEGGIRIFTERRPASKRGPKPRKSGQDRFSARCHKLLHLYFLLPALGAEGRRRIGQRTVERVAADAEGALDHLDESTVRRVKRRATRGGNK